MSKDLLEKHFDVRVVNRYLKAGQLSKKDVDDHFAALPNDEGNFELVMLEDDDLNDGDSLSEAEIEAMPAMTEDSIDNFDFIKKP